MIRDIKHYLKSKIILPLDSEGEDSKSDFLDKEYLLNQADDNDLKDIDGVLDLIKR